MLGLVLFTLPALGTHLPVHMKRRGYPIDVLIGEKPFTTYYFDPAMGGMAAQIPIKSDQAANGKALEKVRQDKLREVKARHEAQAACQLTT